jgi:hypothetical protein
LRENGFDLYEHGASGLRPAAATLDHRKMVFALKRDLAHEITNPV